MVSVYRAVKAIFPEMVVLPGGTNIFVASKDPLTVDPSLLAERLQTRGIRTRIVSAAYLRYLYTNDRFRDVAGILEAGTAPVNTDARPICYQYTIMIWLSKFLQSSHIMDSAWLESLGSRRAILVWLISLSLPALWLSRTGWPTRRTVLTGVAGFAGMVSETILILHFQAKNGILFQDVGVLLTSFMTGLAWGASVMAGMGRHASRGLGVGIFIAFVVLNALIGVGINANVGSGLASSLCLLIIAGFLVAGVFGYASIQETSNQGNVITPLYSADLIGGALGSLLASLIMVPIAGLSVTALLMIPLLALSALLV
jgi:hypothetical protein